MSLSIRIPGALSLKEKRFVLKSLVTRIRNRFNVSVSEVDSQDKWQLATLGVAHVAGDRRFSNQVLDGVLDFAEAVKQIEVLDSNIEFL